MYTRSRLYENNRNRSSSYLGLSLEGLKKNRTPSDRWSNFSCFGSKKIRINWAHRLF